MIGYGRLPPGLLPLSPCGRGWTRFEASWTGEGSVSADRDASSGALCAPPSPTSGRREEATARWASLNQHAHDVGLLHDQEILAVELDLGARPFAEQHAVADLEVDRDQLAGLVAAARAHGGDFALRGLFLGGVGDDDAALGLLFGVDALDHDAVMQRTELGLGHDVSLEVFSDRFAVK